MLKVSVIIPVYNAEKYLGECLDSILGQTLRDIEVLCVDDGSTDRSARILAEYAAKDARVKLFSSPHAGAAGVRNLGLAEARGDYLFFCDADDWIDRSTLSSLHARASQADADLAVTGLRYFDSGTGMTYRVWNSPARAEAFSPLALGDGLFSDLRAQIGGKLVRRQFILDTDLSFQDQPRANDVAFVAVALATARRIVVDGEAHYHYRKNHGGNLSAGINDHPDMAAYAWLRVKGELERRGLLKPFKRALERTASQALVNSLLAITDPAVAESFFIRVRDELLPRFGFEKDDVAESARVFFDDPGPLGVFMARLLREKDNRQRERARLQECSAELSRIKSSRAWRFLSFFTRLFHGDGVRPARNLRNEVQYGCCGRKIRD